MDLGSDQDVMRPLKGSRPTAAFAFLTLAFATPISIKLFNPGTGVEVVTPAEPIAGIFALLVLFTILSELWSKGILNKKVTDPLTLVVLVDLVLQWLSVMASNMPVVSVKAVMVQTVFVLVFFLPWSMLRWDRSWLVEILKWHSAGMALVVAWTMYHGWDGGMDRSSVGYASMPFYHDRTIYSAALTFTLFHMLILASLAMRKGQGRQGRWLLGLAMLFLGAVLLSFTRASWVALLAMAPLALVLALRLRPVHLVPMLLAVSVAGWSFSGPLTRMASEVQADADADDAGVREQALSVLNLHTDWSNRERLNRWSCAWRMFQDAPILGNGQGTFQFIYPAYQRKEERTYLSVPDSVRVTWIKPYSGLGGSLIIPDNPQPLSFSGGTAHSEYLLRLSERGLLGLIPFLVLMAMVMLSMMRYAARHDRDINMMPSLLAGAAVLAYGVHALFNNYLDDPKVALPFWCTLALFIQLSDNAGEGASPFTDHERPPFRSEHPPLGPPQSGESEDQKRRDQHGDRNP